MVIDDVLHVHPQPKDEQFQPSSIDLTLDYKFTSYNHKSLPYIDTKDKYLRLDEHVVETVLKYKYEPFIIHPDDFVLAQTRECVGLPDDLVGVVEGRSSFGRLGLLVHATAGYVDPGFEGNITLEMKNINNVPLALYPEQRICQLVVHRMDEGCEYPYGCESLRSKYQFQSVPTVSRVNEDLL